MWTQHNPRVPVSVIAMISKVFFWQISSIIIKFVFRDSVYFNPSSVHVVLNWCWAHFGINYQENQIGAWSRSCFWPLIAHQQTTSYKPRTSWGLSICILTSAQNYFRNSLRQNSKLTWNEVDNWCNLTASFSSR